MTLLIYDGLIIIKSKTPKPITLNHANYLIKNGYNIEDVIFVVET